MASPWIRPATYVAPCLPRITSFVWLPSGKSWRSSFSSTWAGDGLGSMSASFDVRRPLLSRAPMFGDYLCVPESDIHHIHGTSGTTGRPTAFCIDRGDWQAIANAHARIMWGMGILPEYTVFIAAIFSLYRGSWGTLAGAERLRCKSFPFGAGAPGMSARAAMWLANFKPQAFYGTPSFARDPGARTATVRPVRRASYPSRSASSSWAL